MTTQQSAPRQWVVQPGQPAPGLWWDRNNYRPINPSAPYPTSTKRSMRSVGTTIGLSLLILAVVALIVGMKFPPLLLLAAGLFCAGAVMFGLTTHVANKWVGKGEKDLHSTRDVLTQLYSATPPAGWWQSSDRDAVYVQQDGLVLLGGAKNMASEQLRPIFPVWRKGDLTVGAHMSSWSLTNASITVGDNITYFSRHMATCVLPGRYALPPMRVGHENTLTRAVSITTGADRDTVYADFNKNFTVSVCATDHPLLEPHLLTLLNAEVDKGYIYHFEGDLLVILSQQVNTDVAALAYHAEQVMGAIPKYLYQ